MTTQMPLETVTAFDVRPEATVAYKNELHRVCAVLSLDRVIIQHVQSGRTESVLLDHLRHPSTVLELSAEKAEPLPALEAFSQAEQDLAKKRLEQLGELIGKDSRTREDVARVATTMDLSTASVYRLIKDYEQAGSLVGLIPGQRGPKGPRLPERVEEIIRDIINELYLQDQKLKVVDVFQELEERCKAEKLKLPHINSVRNRIKKIPAKEVLRGRGYSQEADKFTPTPGEFPPTRNVLGVVQIDHVRLDITVVYSDTREPWGRPWLTLVIDVMTRMIVGFYLSMSAPSSTSAGMALAMGMLPKKNYLADLGLSGSWPVQGKIHKVHCDNAKEFRGAVLEHACHEQRIDTEFRRVKTPRYGGHIERMIGNVNMMLQKKPGTTFSNPQKRGDYDSKKKSAYTLRELEVEIADWIVNHYHVSKHGALKKPPIKAWEEASLGTSKTPACGLPQLITNPEKLVFDFLPQDTRVVSPTGIRINKADYFSEVLIPWINYADPKTGKKKKFVIKEHPRRRNAIWFLDPQTRQYYRIPQFPPPPDTDYENQLTGEEFSALRSRDDAVGKAMEDTDAKAGYRQRSKEREAASVALTTTARKAARSGKSNQAGKKPTKPKQPDRSQIEDRMLGGVNTAPDPSEAFSGFSNAPVMPFTTRS